MIAGSDWNCRLLKHFSRAHLKGPDSDRIILLTSNFVEDYGIPTPRDSMGQSYLICYRRISVTANTLFSFYKHAPFLAEAERA